ncbi:MAG: hypothetical protein HRT38_11600 [Alteromonadaceae bacterium]|nr:hypothetical protein [Alteromonadaceae bacterium]
MTLTNKKTNAKKLFSLLLFTMTVSTSVDATELVKVEKLNKVEFSVNTEMNLSQSIQLMQISINSVQNTAKTLLSNQITNLDNKSAETTEKATLLAD